MWTKRIVGRYTFPAPPFLEAPCPTSLCPGKPCFPAHTEAPHSIILQFPAAPCPATPLPETHWKPTLLHKQVLNSALPQVPEASFPHAHGGLTASPSVALYPAALCLKLRTPAAPTQADSMCHCSAGTRRPTPPHIEFCALHPTL